MKRIFLALFFAVACLATPGMHAQGTSFAYSGELYDLNQPANGSYEFRFTLYDSASLGQVVGSPIQVNNVAVANSAFTLMLDFGDVFNGSDRWLQIEVRPSIVNPPAFAIQTPRVKISSIPYAITAEKVSGSIDASQISGTLNNANLANGAVDSAKLANAAVDTTKIVNGAIDTTKLADGSVTTAKIPDSAITTAKLQDGTITLQKIADGSVATAKLADGSVATAKITDSSVTAAKLAAGIPSSGKVLGYDGSALAWTTPSGGSSGWLLSGNADTTEGLNFLGTTDNKQLEVRANNFTALRVEPTTANLPYSTPNLVGGDTNNSILASVFGSVIGGGGLTTGNHNTISANLSFIGGGDGNAITSGSQNGTIAGGSVNTIASIYSTIGGGQGNVVGPGSANSFLGGGVRNYVNGADSVLGGGHLNTILGTIGIIMGGENNYIAAPAQYSAISGGQNNTNAANYASIAGGELNFITANAPYAAIPGGFGATARSRGQMVFASGSLAINGDAQASVYVLRTTTTDGVTPMELTATDPFTAGGQMIMPRNSVWAFDIFIVASSNTGQSAGYEIKGVARCAATGIVTLLPSLIPPTVLYNDGATAWVVNVSGDTGGSGPLKLIATGEANTSINWVASVRTAEVIK